MAARRTSTRQQNQTLNSRGQGYVYGNTVRKLEPVRQRPEVSEPDSRTRARYRVRRNQEKALQMDLPYVIALMIAAVCMLWLCVSYIELQSTLTARMDTIQELEQELEAARVANDALETNINTSVDLDYVYQVATEELGMVYAGRDQVLLYDRTESEYVRQYEDIPER